MVLIHKAKGPIYGGTDTSHKGSVVLIGCHKAGGSGTQATARDQSTVISNPLPGNIKRVPSIKNSSPALQIFFRQCGPTASK